MNTSLNRLEKERKTIKVMIKMYCKKFHNTEIELCQSCLELFEYADDRLKYCRFGESKPVCEKCPVHCYEPHMRQYIRTVMRYAGPRMIYSHPIIGFRHLFKKIKKFDNNI